MIVADVVRAVGFVGIAAVGSFPAMLAFALIAGMGSGLFSPAALASLSDIAGGERIAAMTSLYGSAGDTGRTLGPLVAVAAFVCSIGNVPLAAVLWNGGISFGGVVSFIFADLIILPLLVIYAKYYGRRMAIFLTGTCASMAFRKRMNSW